MKRGEILTTKSKSDSSPNKKKKKDQSQSNSSKNTKPDKNNSNKKTNKKSSVKNNSNKKNKPTNKTKKKTSKQQGSSNNKPRKTQSKKVSNNNKKYKGRKPKKELSKREKMMNFINNNSFLSTLWSLGFVLILFAILYVVAIFFLPKQTIQNNYMEGTLSEGDKVIYLNIGDISQFDLVVYTNPETKEDEVGRVVGMPGTTVSYKDGGLVVDDSTGTEEIIKNLTDAYQTEHPNEYYTKNFEFKDIPGVTDDMTKIPDGNYLILGDNRPEAVDGRSFGFVSSSDIKGKVYFRYYPISKTGLIK